MIKRDIQTKPLTVEELYKSQQNELKLTLIAGSEGTDKQICIPLIQKPGLRLAGVSDLQPGRIQVFGRSEAKYIASLSKDDLRAFLKASRHSTIPCIVFSEEAEVPLVFKDLTEEAAMPLFKSNLTAVAFIDSVSKYLEERLAPATTMHGVLVDVLGIGIIIQGKSGIGKSECALDLVSKGYRLVADDMVILKKKGPLALFGSAADVTKYHMEVRGLGVINIRDLFGITAIREEKLLDIVVELVPWSLGSEYDRLGITENFINILGVDIPKFKIPLSPGRSIATIIEVAARNHIIKIMGKSPARDFEKQLNRAISSKKRGSGG